MIAWIIFHAVIIAWGLVALRSAGRQETQQTLQTA